MGNRKTPRITLRKQPKQARSAELVAAILKAAVQVLAKDGAGRFTTARVAEKAGVSIGSLYQYFPNKAAILFRLQKDEWRRTGELLRGILLDVQKPPLERLRVLVRSFLRSECDEAAIRVALADAAPLYREAPEALEARKPANRDLQAFLPALLPDAAEETRTLAGGLILTTLNSAGKRFSESPRTPAEVDAYAEAMADMFCAYLATLGQDFHRTLPFSGALGRP